MLKFIHGDPIGVFIGAGERDFGFAADIVIPYKKGELRQAQLGQFLLVRLSGEDYTLGRITRFTPAGMLATAEGEDYMTRMMPREGTDSADIPEDLKQAKIKYRVNLKLLGAVKRVDNGAGFIYAPSQRRLPHLGEPVYWLNNDLRREICCYAAPDGAQLGHFALGEFVYSGDKKHDDYFVHLSPKLPVTFDVNNLVSRRTAVFARAGFGKSNLIKLLTAELYKNGTPKTAQGKPAGVLIFDADGEYFWPDANNRPGLCNVPHLSKHIVVYTKRDRKNTPYQQWKAGGIKLDLRELSPGDVFGTILSDERQEQQNVLKLKFMGGKKWRTLVDLMYEKGIGASDEEIGAALGYTGNQIQNAVIKAEINAARSNAHYVVRMLHDPESALIKNTLNSLRKGKLVIVDISLLSAKGGEVVAALLMRKIFAHNQEEFTNDKVIPTIAVIEEAQSVLGGKLSDTSPFVEWVKEGRKYELGAILITQQPGSLAQELLSQTDNWFCFHLLSAGDTAVLGKHNSHYSQDILSHIVAEPIKGNCYMWTSDQPFVLPLRVHSFEDECRKYIENARGGKTSAG